MNYKRFNIEKYKAIKDSSIAVLKEPMPIIGVNESGKSSGLEAIAHFDYRNDPIADQREWKFVNRYLPTENEFIVAAEIDFSQAEIQPFLDTLIEEETSQISSLLTTDLIIKRIFRKDSNPALRRYRIADQESDLVERIAKEIIAKLPKIFYFDNFLENQFPNLVDFPPEYFSDPNFQLNEHQVIVEGMFTDSSHDLKKFLDETDENTKDTIISEVNRNITAKLIDDWKKMHFKADDLELSSVADLEINLQQNRQNNHAIDINIVEKFMDESKKEHKTSMLLGERSLGFRWFFNFSAKKCFGARGEEKFIYLFDEPGSYLHNGAQSVLLKAVSDLAKTHSVIYSTHSEFLLDPEIININNIKIVEKNDREIRFIPLAQAGEKKHMGALSTLYNALRMKIPIGSVLKQKVMVTEGITDFYFWRMLTKNIVILPGFGAGQNEYLISIAIGASKKYLAFFDGDEAGEQAVVKYKKFFGDEESKNWKKYLDKKSQEIKLEKIFSAIDKDRLCKLMETQDVKRALTSLFFSERYEEFWNGIDQETRDNLNKNIQVIKNRLNLKSNKTFKYKLD